MIMYTAWYSPSMSRPLPVLRLATSIGSSNTTQHASVSPSTTAIFGAHAVFLSSSAWK